MPAGFFSVKLCLFELFVYTKTMSVPAEFYSL